MTIRVQRLLFSRSQLDHSILGFGQYRHVYVHCLSITSCIVIGPVFSIRVSRPMGIPVLAFFWYLQLIVYKLRFMTYSFVTRLWTAHGLRRRSIRGMLSLFSRMKVKSIIVISWPKFWWFLRHCCLHLHLELRVRSLSLHKKLDFSLLQLCND